MNAAIEVEILAASKAAVHGLRALADLAATEAGSNYRIVGGPRDETRTESGSTEQRLLHIPRVYCRISTG
ncbi:hypothetical protein B9C99_12680 [Rhodococcus sp. BUPNP1]|nr:hypothetical protein B9C99_12680 [Rhodococcus sp. BUPNP1]